MNTSVGTLRVESLWRYPVKSMGGERITDAQIFANGIIGDHRFGVIDVETDEIASAKMTRKWGHLLNFTASYVDEPIPRTPLPPLRIKFPDGQMHMSDSIRIHSLLSKELGREVRLTDTSPETAVSEALWKVVDGHESTAWTRERIVGTVGDQDLIRWQLSGAVPDVPGESTFFDLSTLHILTTATTRRLHELAPDCSFDAQRFRPNIVLHSDVDGFLEQEWVGKTLEIGAMKFFVTLPTPRCGMPTLEQKHEGVAGDRRVLKAIARHNTLEIDAMGEGRWACAGVFANPIGIGSINLGAEVVVRETDAAELAAMNGE